MARHDRMDDLAGQLGETAEIDGTDRAEQRDRDGEHDDERRREAFVLRDQDEEDEEQAHRKNRDGLRLALNLLARDAAQSYPMPLGRLSATRFSIAERACPELAPEPGEPSISSALYSLNRMIETLSVA